jgi:hypothetical protein
MQPDAVNWLKDEFSGGKCRQGLPRRRQSGIACIGRPQRAA